MMQSNWTQNMLATLKREGLIQESLVNIRTNAEGAYVLQVADHDNEVYEITVRQIS